MALINCPECGKEISDTCESCIHCGYKMIKTIDIEEKQTNKKKLLSKPIIIVIVSVIALLIIVLVVNKSLHTYSYEEEVCYNAVKYFYTFFDSPDDLKIYQIEISPATSVYFKPKNSYSFSKKYHRDNIVVISYTEKNNYGIDAQQKYYIKMMFEDVSPYQDEVQQDYQDDLSIKVNVNKINYALEHPEVIKE